jgi:hypothetical protein
MPTCRTPLKEADLQGKVPTTTLEIQNPGLVLPSPFPATLGKHLGLSVPVLMRALSMNIWKRPSHSDRVGSAFY